MTMSTKPSIEQRAAAFPARGAAAGLLARPGCCWPATWPCRPSRSRRRRRQAKAKSVIQIWLWGGPSHLDTFDPKPEAGNDYCGPLEQAHRHQRRRASGSASCCRCWPSRPTSTRSSAA